MHVGPLAPALRQDAASLLTRALSEDPSAEYSFPDPSSRTRKLDWYHRWLLRIAERGGVVDATGPELAGVAIWMPPGAERLTVGRRLRAGGYTAPFALGLGSTRRLLSSMAALDEVHHRILSGQHWYLVVVGVDPAHQGQGVGSLLMRHALDRADGDGMSCYLETTSRASRKTFEQFGFHVVGEAVGARGLPAWTMVRKPVATQPVAS